MRKKRVVTAIGAGVAVLGLLVWAAVPPREPVYQGKKLSEWAYVSNTVEVNQFMDAVRATGTDAVPVLLRLLQAHDSPLEDRLRTLAQKQHWFKVQRPDPNHAYYLNAAGMWGFFVLTNRAASAVPNLVRIYDQKLSPSSQEMVAESLQFFGSDARAATPSLLRETGNTNNQVRRSAFHALAMIGDDPTVLVPLFINGLNDSSPNVQYDSARGLGNFGSAAKSAVPALTDFIRAPVKPREDPSIRTAALDALKKIDAEAAEKLARELPKDGAGN